MTADIVLRDVHKSFELRGARFGESRRLRAVDGVRASVQAGSCLGIVGESGCGKSTLARLILGLLPVTSGEILIGGKRLSDMDRRARARLIQPVFQDPFSSLNPRRKVRDIVGLPLTAQGIGGRARRARVEEMLACVGLSDSVGERLPAQLSGGQRQRVAIARALVVRPRIVIFDEPTSALDVSVQAQILNLLAGLQRDLGLTTIFVSHNLAVVEHICDEVAVMYLGRFVEHAATDDLFRAPLHPYTRALLASVLTPDPGLGVPDVGLNDSPPNPANIPPGCRFHPRCPEAQAICRTATPEPRRLLGRTVECLLAQQPHGAAEPAVAASFTK